MLERILKAATLVLRANVHLTQAVLIAFERIHQDAEGASLVVPDRAPLDAALDARRINPTVGVYDDYGPD